MNTPLICSTENHYTAPYGIDHEASHDASSQLNPLSPSSKMYNSLDKNIPPFSFKSSNTDSFDSLDSHCSSIKPLLKSESSSDDSSFVPLNQSEARGIFVNPNDTPLTTAFDARKRGYGDCGCVSSAELAEVMNDDADRQLLILLDVRENRVYHTNHILGARHANCTTKLMVKRAIANWNSWYTNGQAPAGSQVVIYDQKSAAPNTSKPLNSFLTHLLQNGNHVKFLENGFDNFSYMARPELISSNLTEDSIRRHSYSPTSPECPTEDVLNATASEILPYLYLGNERDTKDCDLLKNLGITHILNMTEHIPFHLKRLNMFTYKRLPASDCQQQDLRKFFAESILFIEEARDNGGKVLIHCWAGVSRSASIVMAYLLKSTHLKLSEILEFTRKQRSVVAPNFNFMGQLERYSHSLTGDKQGVISKELRNTILHAITTLTPVQPERSVSTSSTDSGVSVSSDEAMEVDERCPSPTNQIRCPFLK